MSTIALPQSRRRQGGFTIVEMMVALAISLVVILGFAVSFVNMKQAFNSQDSMAALQDNERLASVVLSSSLNEAGYFPTGANPNASPVVLPTVVDRSSFPTSSDSVGGSMAAGNYLYGTTASGTTVVESISTAYMSASGDGLLNCQGATNTSGSNQVIRNIFYVMAGTTTLGCSVITMPVGGGAPVTSAFQPLVSGVSSMSVNYGVDVDGDGAIDTYVTAANVAAAQWGNIKNLRITLNFVNPNAKQDTSNPTIPLIQVVNIMNNKQ